MDKAATHIILRITNQGIFYNQKSFIEWQDTNFPPKDKFSINERVEIYWKVKLLSFDKNIFQLEVEVTDYEAIQDKDSLSSQNEKYPVLKLLFARRLSWVELGKIMNFYKSQEFSKISDIDEVQKNGRDKKIDDGHIDFSEGNSGNIPIEVNRMYPLAKTKFIKSAVELEINLDRFHKKVKIRLHNKHILPEFDHVKRYFAKALGEKCIEVTGFCEIDNDGKVLDKCESKEINQINENLIKVVRQLQLSDSIFKPGNATASKSMYTPEEYFDRFGKGLLGSMIKKSDVEIMKDLIQIEEIRNQNQLMYLSGKLQSHKMGLRFTLSPKFGFLFYVEGKEADHFIWELLNTNATYIWSLGREATSLENNLQRIEREINIIRENGRKKYSPSKIFTFNKIIHKSGKNELSDGFGAWLKRVDEVTS